MGKVINVDFRPEDTEREREKDAKVDTLLAAIGAEKGSRIHE